MRENKEMELKLTCNLSDLTSLRQWPRLMVALKAGDDLESVYFDTVDHVLQKSGYVLRVRKTLAGYVQTAKGDGDGLIERDEWERPIASSMPDLDALKRTPLKALLGKEPKLLPQFAVFIERATCTIQQGVSQIEVALDHGRVTMLDDEDGSTPENICEVELELKRGNAADLFALAREIGSQVPVRLGVRSKAERGFELDRSDRGGAQKAEPVALSAEMSAADAFRAVAHACLRHMRVNEDILLEGRDPDALHQTRVAIRRLRSAFSLFGVLLRDDAQFETIQADLKRLSAPLGTARNLDVFLLKTLPAERLRNLDHVDILNLEKQLEMDRTAAYAVVDERLRSEEWRRFCINLVAWINAGSWLNSSDAEARGEPLAAFATRVLDKRRLQVKKRGRNLSDLSPEARHQVRIAAKKLRYGTEFFSAAFSGKRPSKRYLKFAAALSDLQDALGALNDIVTGHELLEAVAGASVEGEVIFTAGQTAAEGDALTRDLLAAANKAFEELIEVRPFWR